MAIFKASEALAGAKKKPDGSPNEKKDNFFSSSLHCALEYERPCCRNTGLNLKQSGPFLGAEVCKCVSECSVCRGSFLKIDTDGTSRPCQQPPPKKIINLFNQAEIPARYLDSGLARFSNYTGNGQKIVTQLDGWIRKYDEDPLGHRGILLFGGVGVGKTYLLAALAKSLIFKGHSVRFVDFFQLISTIKGAYSERKSDQRILSPLLDAEVLIIDEMGKGRNTEFEMTVLDQLVMGRYNQGGVLIASTNYTTEPSRNTAAYHSTVDFEKEGFQSNDTFQPNVFGSLEDRVGSRIFSRLQETCYFLNMTGSDYRASQNPKIEDLVP